MRTFAEKAKASQQTTPVKTTPCWADPRQSPAARPPLRSQPATENQAEQTPANAPVAELTDTAAPRFAHDFSRIPVRASGPGTVQTTQAGARRRPDAHGQKPAQA